jgi:hypothetical protein
VAEATGQAARSFKLYDKCKRASEVALTRMNLETPRTYDASLAGVCASKGTEEPHEHWSGILADHDGRSGGSPRRGTCVWFDLSAHATRN